MKSEPRDTPKLSDKEIAKRKAKGLCFNCGEMGHLSHNCPPGQSVTHTGNKPPGRSSFNIELGAMTRIEEASDPEVLDSLPLGAIGFGEDQSAARDWETQGPVPRNFIGDCFGMFAKHVLDDCQPYPGDEHYDTFYVECFTLIPYQKHYQIIDAHTAVCIS